MNYKQFGNLGTDSVSINDNYTRYLQFGSAMNDQVKSPFNAANPLTYCLFPSLGSQFQHGSSTSNLLKTTYNPNCEYFMAERCSKEWDGFCEAYRKINLDTYWPNVGVIDALAYNNAQVYLKNNRPTVGEVLVRNAVNIKLLDFPYQQETKTQFDPNTANSPDITIYPNYTMSPSFLKKITNVESDPHVTLMLDNPTPCFDVLSRIYLGILRNEPNAQPYVGSRVQKYFSEHESLFVGFLRQAISLVPSYTITPKQDHVYQSCTGTPNLL